ncbi:MAG: aspartate-semialdehyde dehydrogenase [Lachnospiraceae bacterium]
MEQKLRVGILGATGMVGQRFLTLLENHPWFEVVVVAASEKNRGKTYEEAVNGRWKMDMDIPESVKKQKLMVVEEVDQIAPLVDLVFSAVDMGKEEIRKFEEAYAKAEVVVMSNNSAHRWTADVPMLIPEVNPSHLEVIASQKKRLGTKRGFIAVKPNCSIQSYAPALYALNQFGPTRVVVTTYQAISGSGKNFETWPQMVGNVIPYIGGEEEKSEKEPLKLFGKVENGVIVSAVQPQITSQCVRVPVLNGHTAAVFVDFLKKPTKEEIIRCWREFSGLPQEKKLPHAPKQFLHYFDEEDRPQVALDVDYEGGMGITLGRLREDTLFDYKFIGLSHNTLRGAAGGGVLSAELLYSLGYLAK